LCASEIDHNYVLHHFDTVFVSFGRPGHVHIHWATVFLLEIKFSSYNFDRVCYRISHPNRDPKSVKLVGSRGLVPSIRSQQVSADSDLFAAVASGCCRSLLARGKHGRWCGWHGRAEWSCLLWFCCTRDDSLYCSKFKMDEIPVPCVNSLQIVD